LDGLLLSLGLAEGLLNGFLLLLGFAVKSCLP
jgi:hypothetical protein